MTDIAHMYPDLMGSAGIKLQADVGEIFLFVIGEKFVMSSGSFTMFKVNTAQDGRIFCPSMGASMMPSFYLAADNSPVLSVDLSVEHLV